MVSISIQHGMSGAAAYAYACLGSVLGANFHRYREGYRLAKLACDLVEKHGFTAYDTKVYHAMGLAAFWTEPITSVIDLRRATTRTATERGDLTFACYGMHQSITCLLTAQRSARRSVARVGDSGGLRSDSEVPRRRGPHREPATLHREHAGSHANFSTFSDAQFDEAAFEAQLAAEPDADPDLLALDPQTQGAVPLRRLRRGPARQPTRRRHCFAPPPCSSSCSTTSTTPR